MMEKFGKWSCLDREKEKYSLGEKDIRRWYQRDIDQITHSTAFRKLQQKSQLLSEKDPRSRSRMIHTIEVSRIATEISEKLNVSKELTEAICFAHDIATAPYGFVGNQYLIDKVKGDFTHEYAGALQLLRLSKKKVSEDDEDLINQIDNAMLENDTGMPRVNVKGSPFSLYASKETYISEGEEEVTYYIHHISPEIIDGVMNHGNRGVPNTIEGQIVQIADNIAYLSQDIEDLLSTKIISEQEFKRYANNKAIKYKDHGVDKELLWSEINEELGDLKDTFNKSRGRRVAALVNRFVEYNLRFIIDYSVDKRHSELLEKEIPILKIDEDMQVVINFIWSYIESKYNDPLIQTSNNIQRQKMEELWTILNDKRFIEKNQSYKNFMKELSASSIFKSFSDDWKRAFFISHLSYTEVDLILDSFHERNFTFDLDIKEI